MMFVERAQSAPNHCVAYPQLGQDHPKGYVFLGPQDGFDNDVYLSTEAFQNAARDFPQLGLATRSELDDANAAIGQLEHKVRHLSDQLAEADAELNAFSLLESRGRIAPTSPKKPAAHAA